MINKVLYSSKSEDWETPEDLFKRLDDEFHFETDLCASVQNAKCQHFYTKEQDGLKQEWKGTCWMNPPYGRQIEKWVEKACKSKAVIVCLLPVRTDTNWFHKYVLGKADEIRFCKGRLKFSNSKVGAPFPSMIVIYRNLKIDKHR